MIPSLTVSIYFVVLILINLIFFKNYKTISKFLNVYDYPDNKRKTHKNPTPLIGGFIILIVSVYCILFTLIFDQKLFLFNSYNELLVFLIVTFLFFIVGLLDDKYEINHNLKLILFTIFIILLMIFDKDLILQNINFTFREKFFDLGFLGYFFSILCFLLFINAFNMIDGINGQAVTYTIFLLIVLITNNIQMIYFISLIFTLIIFLIFNFNTKMFLGDSGTLLIGFIISYFFIKSYNNNNIFYSDEIVLIMLVPGFELLRLAIFRIFKKKHPFKADRNHIHHLILKKHKFLNTFIIIQILFIVPYILFGYLDNSIIILIFTFILYSLIIYRYSSIK